MLTSSSIGKDWRVDFKSPNTISLRQPDTPTSLQFTKIQPTVTNKSPPENNHHAAAKTIPLRQSAWISQA